MLLTILRQNTVIPRRALILGTAGEIAVLPAGQQGTGKKPLVLLNGDLKQRATTEGVPVIYKDSGLITINPGKEDLII